MMWNLAVCVLAAQSVVDQKGLCWGVCHYAVINFFCTHAISLFKKTQPIWYMLQFCQKLSVLIVSNLCRPHKYLLMLFHSTAFTQTARARLAIHPSLHPRYILTMIMNNKCHHRSSDPMQDDAKLAFINYFYCKALAYCTLLFMAQDYVIRI